MRATPLVPGGRDTSDDEGAFRCRLDSTTVGTSGRPFPEGRVGATAPLRRAVREDEVVPCRVAR
ncbi:hypothetical protein [Thermostaphylospora chromogena]|uniref:hypothetical protein n=1 Tax=Thermostaphylospora chromogena TaxID=35622 RepID=UPI001041C512|nr:hypothetical protein [Thermostaphylospora chromogena]